MDKITQVDQKGLVIARPEGATGKPPTTAGRKILTASPSLSITMANKSIRAPLLAIFPPAL